MQCVEKDSHWKQCKKEEDNASHKMITSLIIIMTIIMFGYTKINPDVEKPDIFFGAKADFK